MAFLSRNVWLEHPKTICQFCLRQACGKSKISQ